MVLNIAVLAGRFRAEVDRRRGAVGRGGLLRHLVRPLQNDRPQTGGSGQGESQHSSAEGNANRNFI